MNEEELETILAIYGDACIVHNDRLAVTFETPLGQVHLTVFTAPLHVYPRFTIEPYWIIPECGGKNCLYDLPVDLRDSIITAFDTIQSKSRGEPFVYAWISDLQGILSNYDFSPYFGKILDGDCFEVESVEESEVLSVNGKADGAYPQIFTATETIADRKSVFQGHCARVHSHSDVDAVLNSLLANKRIARASHNIMAYKFKDRIKGVMQCDFDDDGEAAAGGKLLHMLQLSNSSNVVVVVTRWFGGTHLGPIRFKHINNAAKLALSEYNFC